MKSISISNFCYPEKVMEKVRTKGKLCIIFIWLLINTNNSKISSNYTNIHYYFYTKIQCNCRFQWSKIWTTTSTYYTNYQILSCKSCQKCTFLNCSAKKLQIIYRQNTNVWGRIQSVKLVSCFNVLHTWNFITSLVHVPKTCLCRIKQIWTTKLENKIHFEKFVKIPMQHKRKQLQHISQFVHIIVSSSFLQCQELFKAQCYVCKYYYFSQNITHLSKCNIYPHWPKVKLKFYQNNLN